MTQPPRKPVTWYTIPDSLRFILRRKRLVGWSLLLFLATAGLTTLVFQLSTDYVDGLVSSFLATAPPSEGILGWLKYHGWVAGKYLFLMITRIVSFYLAFLFAYCITTPGYVFLSVSSEKIQAGSEYVPDEDFTLLTILRDIFEGLKIGAFGILVTVFALFINFIPLVGQAGVFLLYVYYSALMFIDFPASRRHWSLGTKIAWIRSHSSESFRIGLLPALVSLVPVLNIFMLSLLFPLLTVHSTLNFCSLENSRGAKNT